MNTGAELLPNTFVAGCTAELPKAGTAPPPNGLLPAEVPVKLPNALTAG